MKLFKKEDNTKNHRSILNLFLKENSVATINTVSAEEQHQQEELLGKYLNEVEDNLRKFDNSASNVESSRVINSNGKNGNQEIDISSASSAAYQDDDDDTGSLLVGWPSAK